MFRCSRALIALLFAFALAAPAAAQTIVINPADTKLQWSVDVCTPNCAATSYELSIVKTVKDVLDWKPIGNATKVGESWQMPAPAMADGAYILNLRGRNTFREGPPSDPLFISVINGAKAPGKPQGFTVIVIGQSATAPPQE